MEREEKQPLVKLSTVVATGLAAALAAFFTSRFGITGTVLGTALMAMIITAASALFSVYLERAAAKARNVVPGALRARPSRRSFLLGLGAATSVELSVGKSLSCCGYNECPTKKTTTAQGSTRRTRVRALRSLVVVRKRALPPRNRAASSNPNSLQLPMSKSLPHPRKALNSSPALSLARCLVNNPHPHKPR